MTTIKAIVPDVCIRGVEPKVNKSGGNYLLVRFDDTTGVPADLVDKDMDRQQEYKRGEVVDLHVEITMGKFTNVRIIDVKKREA